MVSDLACHTVALTAIAWSIYRREDAMMSQGELSSMVSKLGTAGSRGRGGGGGGDCFAQAQNRVG